MVLDDLQSIRELLDPQSYPPGTWSDWDAEIHEIPTPAGMTDTPLPDAPACAVPVQAASRLVPFRLGAVQGFSVLSLCLTSFFDFGDKKRPSTFRIVRPVNGLIFGIRFFKLAGGEQHFMLFADGKSTRDSRFSGARGCSHLDGTK